MAKEVWQMECPCQCDCGEWFELEDGRLVASVCSTANG